MITDSFVTHTPVLPAGYTVRAAAVEDLLPVVALINACAQAEIGMDGVEAHEKRADWETPSFNLATDCWVVEAPGGALVGYMEFWDLAPHVKNYCWGRVHPDHAQKGIGTFLLARAEQRAREQIAAAPQGARVVLVNNGADSSANAAANRLLQGQGFRPVRVFTYMDIALDSASPAPDWPDGITVRPYDPQTETYAVYETIEDAFQDHWGHVTLSFDLWKHWNIEEEDHDPALWFLALDGDTIAGAVLCNPSTTGEPDKGWISDLAVRRAYRRRGLGSALLRHAFGALVARGIRRAGLCVDSQSLTGATRLYERAGMLPTHQWLSYEKVLRDGEDISTEVITGGSESHEETQS